MSANLTLDDLQAALAQSEKRLVKNVNETIKTAVRGAIDEMAEIFSEGMQMVADRFDQVDERFNALESDVDDLRINMSDVQTMLIRIDNRTYETTETVKRHTREIRALQRRTT